MLSHVFHLFHRCSDREVFWGKSKYLWQHEQLLNPMINDRSEASALTLRFLRGLGIQIPL